MLLLTLKTDQPEAQVCLFQGETKLAHENWTAHRQLAETIHTKIKDLLKTQQKDWPDIQGIVCYKGPGSFTGLRIGISVANATAYGLQIPVVSANGNNWQAKGIERLLKGEDEGSALPEYGGEIHITQPRK